MYKAPVCLIIRDGWGYNPNPKGNAVKAARTPFINSLIEKYPWILLEAAGEPVGLPQGYQGSSEVGHLNIGAGRVVIQELKRIDDGLGDGSIFEHSKWRDLISKWQAQGTTLHLLALLQDEGVHAHMEHLFKIMRRARQQYPEGKIVIHPFLDGRDTSPRSSLEYLAKLNQVIDEIKKAEIGTMMGRYYAMDRAQNYALTDLAYQCITEAKGFKFSKAKEAVKACWENEKTPDGSPMVDEYIKPMVNNTYQGVKDGDLIFHTNFRQDRAIQLTQAFVEDNYPGKLSYKPIITYLGLTRYYNEFNDYLLEPMGDDGSMEKLLGEIISEANLKQLRIAETQKYRHVTSFFNGKSTIPYPLENQVEVKGRFDPALFAFHPEMEAYLLSKLLLEKYLPKNYPFIVINYANCDMVGHTGVMEAAVKAVEVVDECLALIVPKLLEKNYHVLISADHGNAEQMIDYETGLVKTSHTTFPVELIYVAKELRYSGFIVENGQKYGKLSDIALAILALMDLDIPKEMTAELLFKK